MKGAPGAEGPSAREKRALAWQRRLSWLLAPVWTTGLWVGLRAVGGYRIEAVGESRRRYRELRREVSGPLLVCANHLTLADSALVAWALGAPGWWWLHFRELPWNVPELRNFAFTPLRRLGMGIVKCVPIERGGDRGAVGSVLAKLGHLLEAGDSVLVFPEGGRSRSGRVDVEARTYGVGRLLARVPEAAVLCVYLRGTGQFDFSDWPRRGERFRVALALLRPRSEASGLRRSVELGSQVLGKLAELEARVLGEAGGNLAAAGEGAVGARQ